MTAGFLVRSGEGDAVWSIGGRFTVAERYGIEIVGPPARLVEGPSR